MVDLLCLHAVAADGGWAPDRAAHERRRPAGPAADAGGVTLLDLSHNQCRWPVDAAGRCDCAALLPAPAGQAQLFCAAQAVPGKPYCADHAVRAVGRGTKGEREAVRFARNQGDREMLRVASPVSIVAVE